MMEFVADVPDFETNTDQLPSLRAMFHASAQMEGGGLVEMDIVMLDGLPALLTVKKFPQKPKGMSYIAELQVNFAQGYFYICTAFSEHSPTGIRDALIFDQSFRDGVVSFDADGKVIGWVWNPYGLGVSQGAAPNLSDHPELDGRFPDHPLSRCRHCMATFIKSARWSERARRVPLYVDDEAYRDT